MEPEPEPEPQPSALSTTSSTSTSSPALRATPPPEGGKSRTSPLERLSSRRRCISSSSEGSAATPQSTEGRGLLGATAAQSDDGLSSGDSDDDVSSSEYSNSVDEPLNLQPLVDHPAPKPERMPPSETNPFRSCLDRPYVQMEIRWARKYKKKIIVVCEKDDRKAGFFDHDLAWSKYGGTEWESILNIDAEPYQRDEAYAEVMVGKILQKAKNEPEPEPAAAPKNQPGVWDCFLSHHQDAGGDQAQTTQLRLKRVGKTVWYDNGMLDRSTAAMEEGVKHSRYFVLFLTGYKKQDGNAFSSPEPEPEPAMATANEGTLNRLVSNHLAAGGVISEGVPPGGAPSALDSWLCDIDCVSISGTLQDKLGVKAPEDLKLLQDEYADDLDAVVLTLLPAQRVKFKRALEQLPESGSRPHVRSV